MKTLKAGDAVLKRAVFEIKQNAVGRYYFVFKDLTSQALVVSGSFCRRSELEKCLAIVRETAPIAQICDDKSNSAPPYFLFLESNDGFSFSLIGFDGETIFTSKAYKEKSSCIGAIENMKSDSLNAGIIDLVDQE